MVDLLLVVADEELEQWHEGNLSAQPEHYSKVSQPLGIFDVRSPVGNLHMQEMWSAPHILWLYLGSPISRCPILTHIQMHVVEGGSTDKDEEKDAKGCAVSVNSVNGWVRTLEREAGLGMGPCERRGAMFPV